MSNDLSDNNNELMKIQSECERLLEEIKNLKALILSLTAERDELRYHICPDLEAIYNDRIGNIVLELLNAKLRILQLKRTIEIIQSSINRQEKVSEKKARQQANKEYKEFEEDLNRKAEEAKRAGRHKENEEQKEAEWEAEQAEAEENGKERKYKSRTDEMKALYRKIVKALHPDMNPDETEYEKNLFNEAVEAYDNGDIDKLREIAAMIDEGKISEDMLDDDPDNIEHLKEILEGLRSRAEQLQDEIAEIKASFPYNIKDVLEDEDLVFQRQQELTKMLYEYNEEIEELEERLAQMVKDNK